MGDGQLIRSVVLRRDDGEIDLTRLQLRERSCGVLSDQLQSDARVEPAVVGEQAGQNRVRGGHGASDVETPGRSRRFASEIADQALPLFALLLAEGKKSRSRCGQTDLAVVADQETLTQFLFHCLHAPGEG